MDLKVVRLRERNEKESELERLNRYLQAIAIVRGAEIGRMSLKQVDQILDEFDLIVCTSTRFTPKTIWFRARTCTDGEMKKHLSELIYPNPKVRPVSLNRANLPDHPMLYASGNAMTIISEIRAQPGDLVQILAFRVTADPKIECNCLLIGELNYVARAHRSMYGLTENIEEILNFAAIAFDPKHEHRVSNLVQVLVDAFLGELFSKPVADAVEYKATAILADRLLRRASGGNIDAIGYPSVAFHSGQNIAIRPDAFDSKFEVLGCEVWRLNDYLGFGMWDYEVVRTGGKFGADGALIWPSS